MTDETSPAGGQPADAGGLNAIHRDMHALLGQALAALQTLAKAAETASPFLEGEIHAQLREALVAARRFRTRADGRADQLEIDLGDARQNAEYLGDELDWARKVVAAAKAWASSMEGVRPHNLSSQERALLAAVGSSDAW